MPENLNINKNSFTKGMEKLTTRNETKLLTNKNHKAKLPQSFSALNKQDQEAPQFQSQKKQK